MKNINNAKPTIFHILFPALRVLVNLCDVFLMLFAKESNELDIWFNNALSFTA